MNDQLPFALGPLQTKWLEALESGQYSQCKAFLYDGGGYCCLGVAVVAALNKHLETRVGWVLPNEDFVALGLFSDNGASQTSITDSKGVTESLAELNDRGCSFQQIATLLRKVPRHYFKESK